MTSEFAWLLLALGFAHIGYAFIKFRAPLLAGIAAGITGQFGAPEERRTAFWFLMFGPLLVFAGHVAVLAASSGDLALYRLVGFYLLGISALGLLALPKSPFLAGVIISALMLAAGFGLL